jgi:hypothetical protein
LAVRAKIDRTSPVCVRIVCGMVGPSAVAVEDCRVKEIGMEETKLEKLARLSGRVTSKALDALGRRGFDLRGKMSAPISRVPRRAPPPKPKMDE